MRAQFIDPINQQVVPILRAAFGSGRAERNCVDRTRLEQGFGIDSVRVFNIDCITIENDKLKFLFMNYKATEPG